MALNRSEQSIADDPRRDKVTSPVRTSVAIGTVSAAAVYALLRALLDWQANPNDADTLWNLYQTAGPVVIPLIGALWGAIAGARKARAKVTPLDDPRTVITAANGQQELVALVPANAAPGGTTRARRGTR